MKRLEYSYIKKNFEDAGCALLSKEYKNNRSLLAYICICGTKTSIRFDNFIRGTRCQICKANNIKKNRSHKLSFIQEFFIKKGCVLLSPFYVNCMTPLKYICVCGKIAMIRFNDFRKGVRCKNCYSNKITKDRSGGKHWNYKKDRNYIKELSLISSKSHMLLRSSLASINQVKYGKTANLLGYTTRDLWEYLKNHKNWNKVKFLKSWDLDHIFPIKAFVDYGIKDLKLINCLENLQPLSRHDNRSKGSKYSFSDFENWLKRKGITFVTKISN